MNKNKRKSIFLGILGVIIVFTSSLAMVSEQISSNVIVLGLAIGLMITWNSGLSWSKF